MKQRCDFLENFPGFCYNTGVGERKVNTGGAEKKTEYTNTILLGSTLFETMLKEVKDFCDPSLKEDWSHQPHQQVGILGDVNLYMLSCFTKLFAEVGKGLNSTCTILLQ